MKKLLIAAGVCGAGLLASACADYYPPPPPPPGPPPAVVRERHVRWCYDHHPQYNPGNNVYIGSDGSPHYCVAPWER
jgi:hypothetical protein